MPVYHVTGPDGSTYEVTAPEGATEQDAIAYAQQNLAPKQAEAAPAEKSIYDQINDAGNNMGDAFAHHLGNIPVGIGQGLAHASNSIASGGIQGQMNQQAAQDAYNHSVQGLVNPQQIAPSAGDKAVGAIDQAVGSRESNYQATVPTNAASTIGAGLGEILPWLTGTGELRAAGALPNVTSKLGKLGLLAGEGGVMGSAQPVTSGDFDKTKVAQIGIGAGTSGLLGGVGMGLSAAKQGIGNALAPAFNPEAVVNENLARLYGSDPATLAKLNNAQSLVPGEVPSAAQVLQTPEAVQAERMFRNHPESGPKFAAQDNANNSARLGLLNNLAGDDATMAAAKATRRANADTYINDNLTPSNPSARWKGAGDAFQSLLAKPGKIPVSDFNATQDANKIVQKVHSGDLQEDDALEALNEIGDTVKSKQGQVVFDAANQAINKNQVDPSGVLKTIATFRNGPLGVDPKIAEGLDFLSTQIKGAQNVRGKIGTDVLDAVRQQASKLLGNATSKQAIGLAPAKNQIVDAIERVAPGYRDYVAQYAKDSQPINDMEAVRGLLDPNAPGSLNAAGDLQLSAPRVKNALRADDKATFSASDPVRTQVENVRDSLLRRSISDNKIAASGSNTAADAQLQPNGLLAKGIFGSSLGNKGGFVGRGVGTAVGGLLGSVGGPVGSIVGAGLGAGVTDAIGAANARIIGRAGATAADAKATAAAIQKWISRQPKAQQQGLLSQYLLGIPASVTSSRP